MADATTFVILVSEKIILASVFAMLASDKMILAFAKTTLAEAKMTLAEAFSAHDEQYFNDLRIFIALKSSNLKKYLYNKVCVYSGKGCRAALIGLYILLVGMKNIFIDTRCKCIKINCYKSNKK